MECGPTASAACASGSSVQPARDFYKLENDDLLIVCDDFNLPLGKIRLRGAGSAGGQKGLDDIIRRLGTDEVPRLRVGIGPVPEGWDPAGFVLGKFARDDAPEIESLDDIRGHAIAVNNGSVYDAWVTDNADRYDLEIQRYGKNADAVQAVLTGRVFANLAGETVAKWAAMQSPLLRTTYTIRSGAKFSAGFRHDDVEYRNRVEETLECMKLDGTMAELHEKWFGDPPADGSAAVTVLEGYGELGMEGDDPTPHVPRCN